MNPATDSQLPDASSDPRPTILVTNDDGISSPGLHAVVACLAPLARVAVIAPDRNRSGVSRSITLGAALQVDEEVVAGADLAFSTTGTPADCVRLALLGLAGATPAVVVSGANNGLNVGDDVAYSGTVSAAFDAAMNALPAIAVSQQSLARELGYPRTSDFDHSAMQRFLPGLVQMALTTPHRLPAGMVINVNVPGVAADELAGVEVTSLARRYYQDRLKLEHQTGGRRHYLLYGDDPRQDLDGDTDISAISRGYVAVTPLRFNVHDYAATAEVEGWNLGSILAAAPDDGEGRSTAQEQA